MLIAFSVEGNSVVAAGGIGNQQQQAAGVSLIAGLSAASIDVVRFLFYLFAAIFRRPSGTRVRRQRPDACLGARQPTTTASIGLPLSAPTQTEPAQ
jgi:hypothetical protein